MGLNLNVKEIIKSYIFSMVDIPDSNCKMPMINCPMPPKKNII